ncbi:Hypothetical predicted protein [Lecanosticta acicola]|uniref:Uncharacterized protein n=1 Tax=Lecanosticta acicola TaxID=111012 RepID=A0AAI8YWA2_9PEZI|nr:Hypothetical predicted protein [Lecanosticta acicola]
MDQEINELLQELGANKALVQQLEASNRRLERTIRELQEKTHRPFIFLDLPLELREMVYELCVAPGKVFLRPRPQNDVRLDEYKKYHQVEWQLLAVTRQVRKESAKVLFTKNQIVFNNRHDGQSDQKHTPILDWHISSPVSLAALCRKSLTSVSIALDLYNNQFKLEDTMALSAVVRMDAGCYTSSRWQGMDQATRVCRSHGYFHGAGLNWEEYLGCVFLNPDLVNASNTLRFLQVDLTNCYCVLGSCRVIEEAAQYLTVHGLSPPLEVIEILGTKTQAERDIVLKELVNPENYKEHKVTDRKPKVVFKSFRIPEQTHTNLMRFLHTTEVEADLEDCEIDLQELVRSDQVDTR